MKPEDGDSSFVYLNRKKKSEPRIANIISRLINIKFITMISSPIKRPMDHCVDCPKRRRMRILMEMGEKKTRNILFWMAFA